MFYQNNNDYMRDAFYYSQPQNTTYQYPDMNNYSPMQGSCPYGRNYGYPQNNLLSNMYPQVYNVIDPVASRVISNNNYPYYTEDNLNNMVDTVYNIVHGDIQNLSNTSSVNENDDAINQVGGTRVVTSTNTTKTTNNVETTRTVSTTSNEQITNRENQLLKDLIKIIIIKQLLSRQNGGCGCNSNNGYNNYNNYNGYTPNYYDSRYFGI